MTKVRTRPYMDPRAGKALVEKMRHGNQKKMKNVRKEDN